jgi:uncharacterized protein with HEPN domain
MGADPRICLHDILTAIAGAREAIGDADFLTSRTRRPMKRAVRREIEIISEACRRIPRKLKSAEPRIPWHEIAASATFCVTTMKSSRPRGLECGP